jgi:hypothetical protein
MVITTCAAFDPKIMFPSRKDLVQKHIPAMLAKTMECYVLLVIATCSSMRITFDLGMFCVSFDICGELHR